MQQQRAVVVELDQDVLAAPRRARRSRAPVEPLRASIGGNGRRRSGRRSSARTIRRPVIFSARPRRTVSTSGSSGMRSPDTADAGAGAVSCPMRGKRRDIFLPDARPRHKRRSRFRLPPGAGDGEGAAGARASSTASPTRYDLMNDLMSARHPPLVEGRDDRLAQAAAGPASARCRRRHRRHRLPRLAAPRSPGSRRRRRSSATSTQQMLEIGRARALDDGILAGIEWVCGDAEALAVRRPQRSTSTRSPSACAT